MTNCEHYKDFLKCSLFSVDIHGQAHSCSMADCRKCIFSKHNDCGEEFIKWLCEEYKAQKVDWSKVGVDTKIIVNNFGKKSNRYFAKYECGKVYYFGAGSTSWSSVDDKYTFYVDEVNARLAEDNE